MTPDQLFILGACVFGILLVGLVLTVLEFRKFDTATGRQRSG